MIAMRSADADTACLGSSALIVLASSKLSLASYELFS